jgi:FMN phosphatase YigB (HAD superfamily)
MTTSTSLVAFDFFGTLGWFAQDGPTSPVHVLWEERDRDRDVDPETLIALVEGINGERQIDAGEKYERWQATAWRAAADYAGVAWSDALGGRLQDVIDGRRLVLAKNAIAALRFLRTRGIPWALSSNASPDVESKLIAMIPAELQPADILVSCRVGARKPHADMYLPLLSHVKNPDEVLFVGDRLDADVLGPLRVGFRAALVYRKSPPPAVPTGAAIIRSLEAISKLIDKVR